MGTNWGGWAGSELGVVTDCMGARGSHFWRQGQKGAKEDEGGARVELRGEGLLEGARGQSLAQGMFWSALSRLVSTQLPPLAV